MYYIQYDMYLCQMFLLFLCPSTPTLKMLELITVFITYVSEDLKLCDTELFFYQIKALKMLPEHPNIVALLGFNVEFSKYSLNLQLQFIILLTISNNYFVQVSFELITCGLYYFFLDAGTLFMAMKHCKRGDLNTYLRNVCTRYDHVRNHPQLLKAACDVARGMCFLQQIKVNTL